MTCRVALSLSAIVVLTLSACSPPRDYDDQFRRLMKKAVAGDFEAANSAYIYCTSELKIQDLSLPYENMGMCGGLPSMLVDDALMSNNPLVMKNTLDIWMDRAAFQPRRAYYFKIARQRLAEICQSTSAPASCKSPEIANWKPGNE